MWHALRAELLYYRSYLLGGFGLAIGVVIMMSLIFFAVCDEGPPAHAAAGIRGMFLIMAPMIVGFVALGLRPEEKRDRLLLAGPVTPGQIAGARVLMSVVLFGVGILAVGLSLGTDFLATGRLEIESLHIIGYVGGLMFAMLQMMPLAQEAVAARSQSRSRAATAGWVGFVVAVLFYAALTVAAFVLQGPLTWPSLHLGNLIVAVTAMVASVALYAGRTDFTQ